MGVKILILLTMIFMHVVDDFYLQGWLASAKQKSWWQNNSPDELYKYDYIVALLMHSFSWSFMIMLPATIYLLIVGGIWYPVFYLVNLIIHMYVDNLKANLHKINLIQDQSIHIVQILLTWLLIIII